MTRLNYLIFILLSIPIANCSSQLLYDKSINKRIEYFSNYLSSFPPQVKDSLEEELMKHQLLTFIDSLQDLRRNNALRNDEQYYLWMAKLYHFGYNLIIPGSWDESAMYYNNALSINPKSTEARMGLSAHYANNWDPGDTNTYQNLYKGFDLLKDVYREGKNVRNPSLYYNMMLFGLTLHSKAICYDAMFKFIKYFPSDTNVHTFESMISSFKDTCIFMENKGSIVKYENTCAKFSVKYPDDYLLFREDHKNKEGIVTFMIETPMTKTSRGDSIRNSFSVTCIPSNSTTESELTDKFLSRGKMIKDSTCNTLKTVNESFYFSSHIGSPDNYKGIYTIIKKNNYYYQIIYVATLSTYKKNLNGFLTFVNSLAL